MTCRDCLYWDCDGFCANLDSQMLNRTKAGDSPACEDFKVFEIDDDCEECRL